MQVPYDHGHSERVPRRVQPPSPHSAVAALILSPLQVLGHSLFCVSGSAFVNRSLKAAVIMLKCCAILPPLHSANHAGGALLAFQVASAHTQAGTLSFKLMPLPVCHWQKHAPGGAFPRPHRDPHVSRVARHCDLPLLCPILARGALLPV